VQIVTRVPLSLYLGPRLVNAVSKVTSRALILISHLFSHAHPAPTGMRAPETAVAVAQCTFFFCGKSLSAKNFGPGTALALFF
jgi:hypothetical protein